MHRDHRALWWHAEEGAIRCDLCPHGCRLTEGKTGRCGVRTVKAGTLVTTTYGTSSGFAADPIEKKPLYHFFPGSKTLSFGTVGCTLSCRFCQNWTISQTADVGRLTRNLAADDVVRTALSSGCSSVAFTYNEPAVFAEWALDTAQACHDAGLKTVAVSAGFFQPAAAREFFGAMDAANIDLKAFSEGFYRHVCGGRLDPVLDTLRLIRRETACWLEVTTLLVPGENDSEAEVGALSRWVRDELGDEVPLHFSAFHPDHRMRDKGPTPAEVVTGARSLALGEGLRFVYTGNISDRAGSTTLCPSCAAMLIQRDGFRVSAFHRVGGRCPGCGASVPGRF